MVSRNASTGATRVAARAGATDATSVTAVPTIIDTTTVHSANTVPPRSVIDGVLVPSSVTVVSNPSRGTVSVDPATGEVTYTATGFFTGADSFQYTVQDDAGQTSSAATVTVVVNRPVANDDFAETTTGTPVNIAVLENDSDPDGNNQIDVSSVKVTVAPAHGTTSVDPVSAVVEASPRDIVASMMPIINCPQRFTWLKKSKG